MLLSTACCRLREGLLARPSVRYRKTINALALVEGGEGGPGGPVGVNAQYYCVLVTDVKQALYEHRGCR